MTLIQLPLVPNCNLVWSCAKLYVLGVKQVLPFRCLRDVADEVALLCENLKNRRRDEAIIAVLTRCLNNAHSQEEYEECATQLDRLQGHDLWKSEKASTEPQYNPDVIEEQIDCLHKVSASSDITSMQHLLRTGLSRDLGGMNALHLYKHSWTGTKDLIDQYIVTAIETIENCVDTAIQYNVPTQELVLLQDSLEDSLKYFGRSALTLSGGATLGMKHIGVVKTLWQADLLPQVISGASAGSIVAAVVGAAKDDEMKEILAHFPTSNLAVFDPVGTNLSGWILQRLYTLLSSRTFFQIQNLENIMKEWLKDCTFREAYNRTGRILNICVSSADSTEPQLLNYITAPDVYLWSAICASCSVPMIFQAANIYEKDPATKTPRLWMQNARQLFVDGSLDHDIPMRKLSEMFNVNFFIVSQVNPHVRAFLDPEVVFKGVAPKAPSWYRRLLPGMKRFVKYEVIHRAQQMSDLGCPSFLYRWVSVLNQQYTGDINVLPAIKLTEFPFMLMNPSARFMATAALDGERATWPRMCQIKNCVAIELALVKAIYALREQVNFSPEARTARQREHRANRGRARRGSFGRTSSRRRRSLSTEHHLVVDVRPNGKGESPVLDTLKVRRNSSMGSINFGLELQSINPRTIPYLSPQAGVEHDLSTDSLMITYKEK